ncbi:hypothetical protein AMATHDRAFT_144681 [Amanita thiersii Skay4041]|uniref:ATP-dependent RNA helicase n=1 Tax=Amanita thiersii Skay4041 TaxID=703135 RepID=A0A2A9NKN6_9AGAR|nr:hypothetical protein AMATHDRAFT_144681 [Amanita thiersii Skay4041]
MSIKRKLHDRQSSTRKRVKEHHAINHLPWKKVSRPLQTGLDGDDGILELEEVDGVEIVYEETERGKVARFKGDSAIEDEGVGVGDEPEGDASEVEHVDEQQLATEEEVVEPFDSENLMPKWHAFSLHPQLLRSLHYNEFKEPTPIQAASLAVAFAHKDVIGVAQTGSGKTLAYGLPILHYLLSQARPAEKKKRRLSALVLAPTRELALQVSSHLNACLNEDGTKATSGASKNKSPPRVSIAAIVGGMSSQKQRRILDRGVDVLVATPGRLWDIIEDDDELAKEIATLKFLVLDEADRMIDAGHFAELDNILRLTLRSNRDGEIPADFNDILVDDVDSEEKPATDKLQTFVFSATLSKDLQRNLSKRPKLPKKRKQSEKPASTLVPDDLLLRLDFRDSQPETIDLSPAGGVVPTLQESKIECISTDKDVYLYYFLLRYPGRSLVFLSSIDGIRRLMPLVELLNIKAFPLHSQLEQRQRLKNLDRFKSNNNSVLLATDIAARGLDIPAVDHVIHYQVPRTADAYIHRNGRTARAMRKGFSLILCAPGERKVVTELFHSLGRDESKVPEMSVELDILDKLKARVQLARQIDRAQHKVKKVKYDQRWMRETAEALGVELDSDMECVLEDDKPSAKNQKVQDGKTAALKAQLRQLLSQPLLAKGISVRYITSGTRPIVDDLLAGEYNENMIGFKKAEAGIELNKPKKKKRKSEQVEKKTDEEGKGIED